MLTVVPGITGVVGGNPVPQYALVHTLPIFGGPTCYGFTDCGLAHTWSLVVELTFYAILPLYALAALRLTRGLGRTKLDAGRARHPRRASRPSRCWPQYVFFDRPSPWIGVTVLGSWLLFAFGMGLAVASVALSGAARQPALVRFTASRPIVPWLAAIAALRRALVSGCPLELFDAEQGRAHGASTSGLGLVAFLLVLPAVFGDERGGPAPPGACATGWSPGWG